jgi:NitT/TauT family transport system permease protein
MKNLITNSIFSYIVLNIKNNPKKSIFIQQIFIGFFLLFCWEYILSPIIGDYWISRPSRIYASVLSLIMSGDLWWHLSATLSAALLGYSIGVVSAVIFAFLAGLNAKIGKIASPYVTAGYSFPKEAVAPLFIILFGIGIGSKVALAIAAVFFIVYQNTLTGVLEVDRDLINVLKISGANRIQLFFLVVAPSSSSWIFSGMRVAIRYAFTAVIFGEMLSGNRGLGFLIKYAANMFNATGVFAGLSIVMIASVFMTIILQKLEQFVDRWRRVNVTL